MKESIFLLASLLLGSGAAMAQYDDDIYYNPDKAAKKSSSKSIVADGRNYNPNLGETAELTDSDIDAYNGFGGYYETAVDTIGAAMANSEDFVYTQQIQKYYNPTIVTDNSAVLADVLANSYGNVNIIYQGGVPYMTSWVYNYPWYTYSYSPYWAFNFTWGPWGYYDPWYWGPSWSWYSPYYWGSPWYGPGYGWAWSYPSYHRWNNYHRNPGAGRPMAHHRYNTGLGRDYRNPGSSRYTASGTRPSTGNRFSGTRYGNTRPVSSVATSRPGTATYNGNSHRGNVGIDNSVRPSTSATVRGNAATRNNRVHGEAMSVSPSRFGVTNTETVSPRVTTTTPRNTTTTTRNATTTTRNTNTTTNTRNYNTTTRNNNNSVMRNNTNTNSHRSSGSSFRSSGGSRGGFGGGGAGRMGGGGSRGGGGHRR